MGCQPRDGKPERLVSAPAGTRSGHLDPCTFTELTADILGKIVELPFLPPAKDGNQLPQPHLQAELFMSLANGCLLRGFPFIHMSTRKGEIMAACPMTLNERHLARPHKDDARPVTHG